MLTSIFSRIEMTTGSQEDDLSNYLSHTHRRRELADQTREQRAAPCFVYTWHNRYFRTSGNGANIRQVGQHTLRTIIEKAVEHSEHCVALSSGAQCRLSPPRFITSNHSAARFDHSPYNFCWPLPCTVKPILRGRAQCLSA